MKQFLREAICLLGIFLVFECSAQVEPSTSSSSFTGALPQEPVAGQPFSITAISGVCEYLAPERSAAQIQSIVGNVVTVVVSSQHDSSCSLPTEARLYDLPALPTPGVYRIRMSFFGPDNGSPAGFMGGRDVNVIAGAAVSASLATIPTLSTAVQAALALLLAMVGLAIFRRLG